jgi:hypothetical protein
MITRFFIALTLILAGMSFTGTCYWIGTEYPNYHSVATFGTLTLLMVGIAWELYQEARLLEGGSGVNG